jgi:hypothetical protein
MIAAMNRPAAFLALMLLAASSALADDAAFTFDGADYFLRSDKNGIREYLTADESFDRWNTLVSVRRFDDLDDAKAYARKLLQTAKSSGPAANGQILEKDGGGVFLVDFLVFPPEDAKEQFAEWNLWRIEEKDGGLEALQFARRFYDFSDASVDEIKSTRNRLIAELDRLTP